MQGGLHTSEDNMKKITEKMDELVKTLNLTNIVLARLLSWDGKTVNENSLVLSQMGFRSKDVAAILGVPDSTVRKVLSRARRRTRH